MAAAHADTAKLEEAAGVEVHQRAAEVTVPVEADAPTLAAEQEVQSSDAAAEAPVALEQPVEVSTEVQSEAATAAPSSPPELDADLATTLGKPKMSKAPTGKLGSLLAGRSMLAPGAGLNEEEGGDALSDTSGLKADYDQEKVMAAWSALVEDLRTKNKMGLAATLSTGELTFEDPTLRLVVANQVQFDELKECATELLHFVRTHVGNGSIAFDVAVGEAVAAPAFLSPKDRYLRWAEENPALESLRNRLDLDLS